MTPKPNTLRDLIGVLRQGLYVSDEKVEEVLREVEAAPAGDAEREGAIKALLDRIDEWGHMPGGDAACDIFDLIERDLRALVAPPPSHD